MDQNLDARVRNLLQFPSLKQCSSLTKALQQLQDELHTEMLPGTEIMRDVASVHFVKSDGQDHRVLVPQPSDDPRDPLVVFLLPSPPATSSLWDLR